MRKLWLGALAVLLLTGDVSPLLAQDGGNEIIVTAFRKLDPDDEDDARRDAKPVLPSAALTLRRTADFAVQQVVITGDTRDEGRRRDEIYAMVKNAIELAGKHGVQLATGELVIEPLTLANYRNLALTEDEDMADAERVVFIVKTPLSSGIDAKTALERISKFIAAVPAVGRAELKADSELTLSIVNPEQYRKPIIQLIAKDAAETAAPFGAGYGVDVTGLDRPVQWTRASLTDVLLFLPASYTVRPRN